MQPILIQRILFCSAVLWCAGCGRDSATTEKSAGISLSISNPGNSVSETNRTTSAAVGQQSAGQSLEAPAVRQLIQKANAAVVAGRNSIAIEALSQAIGLTPEDAELFRMRADVYVLQREMANARADFSTAVRLSPQNAPLYNIRGYFLMSQGLTEEARSDFDKSVQLDPGHAAAWNNRGLLSLASQDYQSALKDFSQALEADRRYADAWNNRSFVRMKLNQNNEALEDIRQALRLKEDYVTAWNNCGLIHMQLEQFEEAEKAFSRLIELSPMDARWFNHRRAARLKQQKFADAQLDSRQMVWLNGLEQLTKEARSNSGNSRKWISRAEYLMNGGQYGAAIQDFTRAILLAPGNPDALTGRAMAWLQTGDLQKAMLDCDESIVSAQSPRAYSVRADIWFNLKNYDQAIADYELASRFDDRVAEAYELRAASLREANQNEEAAADMEKAKSIRDALAGTTPKSSDSSSSPVPFPAEPSE